jgi:LacI family transcriptional regulator
MAHEFPIKEIALQAGVSLATVDRVIHARGGVRKHTVQRINQAIRELRRQSEQAVLAGRKFMIDLVMEAPLRFSTVVRLALEAEMPGMRPAVFRSRFHIAEVLPIKDLIQLLDRIGRRGSHGVLLKAPDVAEVVSAIDRLRDKGIQVFTLVTDIPASRRLAYVGIDNRAAGETAAYLIGQWLHKERAKILVTLSSSRFRGEEEREVGFRRALRERYPHLGIVEVSEGFGINRATGLLVREALEREPQISAVYSIGGGNAAVVAAFRDARRDCKVFIGHDLDADNVALLRAGRISAVLHHDLRQDMRIACQHIMRAHGALPKDTYVPLSHFQIITPFNVPAPELQGT